MDKEELYECLRKFYISAKKQQQKPEDITIKQPLPPFRAVLAKRSLHCFERSVPVASVTVRVFPSVFLRRSIVSNKRNPFSRCSCVSPCSLVAALSVEFAFAPKFRRASVEQQ